MADDADKDWVQPTWQKSSFSEYGPAPRDASSWAGPENPPDWPKIPRPTPASPPPPPPPGGGPPPTDPPSDDPFLHALNQIVTNTAKITDLSIQVSSLDEALRKEFQKAGAPIDPSGSPTGSSSSSDEAVFKKLLTQVAGKSAATTDQWGRDTIPQSPDDRGWRSRANGGADAMNWMHFPGAHATPLDFFKLFGTMTANRASNKQDGFDAVAQPKYDAAIQRLKDDYAKSEGVPVDQVSLSDLNPAEVQKAQKDTMPDESKWGGVSNFFAKAQNGYATGAMMMQGLQALNAKALVPTNYAYETGYQGGGADLPFGLGRFGAIGAGLGQRFSQLGFSLNNDITPGQSADIYNHLFNQGWYGGSSTDAMRQTAANMMQQNPMVASSPDYYTMMDQSTRYGAASLNEFNQVMKGVPDAAKAAHQSIGDVMADMSSMGNFNKSIGGTFYGGIQAAQDWQNVTGTPASVMQTLQQNPFVKGATFSQTGLMPFEQGLASPFQKTQGILGALNMLNRAIVAPKNYAYKDPITGLSKEVSGQQQKEALLAQQMGVSPEMIHVMLSNQKGWQNGMALTNSAETLTQSTIDSVRQGNYGSATQDITGAPWQRLQHTLGGAVDAQGHHIFENWNDYDNLVHGGMGKAKAHRLAQAQAVRAVGNAGDTDVLKNASGGQIGHGLQALGITPGYANNWNYNNLTDDFSAAQRGKLAKYLMQHGDMTERTKVRVASDREALIKKYINKNTQKFGPGSSGNNNGPQLQIELGPAAKKMFHLNSPNGQQKAAAGAGSASINLNSWVNGPTAPPTPNLDTGGSSTFQYGSPNDDGSA